jgi:hypothetical protein
MNTMPRAASKQKLLTDHSALLMVGDGGKGKNRHAVDMLSIQEIQYRAEIMTPVLKAILDFRPRPH